MEVIWIFVGIVIGLAISLAGLLFKSVGSLRIDKSDPSEAPYIFLELKKGIGDISRKKFVILQVKEEDFIPHE